MNPSNTWNGKLEAASMIEKDLTWWILILGDFDILGVSFLAILTQIDYLSLYSRVGATQ